MKTVRSLLLVALLVASAYAECAIRGPADVFVGDHTPLDQVLACSGSLQSVALPPAQLGGYDATTFEVEVYPTFFQGCAFSYGDISLGFAQDSTNNLGQVIFTSGGRTVSTQGVLSLNKWSNIAVVVSNSAPNSQGVVDAASAQIFVNGISFTARTVDPITSASRTGALGYCSTSKAYFAGALDNLIITAAAKSAAEISDSKNLIFPFVLQNDLVQMWTFNDDGASTVAFVGLAAANTASASLVAGTAPSGLVAAGVCQRKAKTLFPGAKTTDVFCRQSGSVSVTGSLSNMQNVAPFQSQEGGISTTFGCQAGAGFTFNQKWAAGGVVEATVKVNMNHRFRVSSNNGGALLVDLQSWGGWTRLSSGSGIISDDRSAFSISESEFVLQVPNMGWISFTQQGGFLTYQYALRKANCPEATCTLMTVEQFQYDFNNPPLPEPMGNMVTTDGILGLPPVLACPPPVLNGYNPFMYCWGWYVGPKVGYVNDWNGRTWQQGDPGCCDNPAIYDGQWSYNSWGSMVAGKKLPWCEAMVVPPIAPPQPQTTIPTYPSDPCGPVDAALVASYKTTCAALWGNDQADGRYVSCVAQLCVTQDPTTVPEPDCRTEKLLAAMDSNYVVPSTCNSCPNSCNFRGTCNSASLVCTCSSGWTGPDCGQPIDYSCFSLDGSQNIQPFQLSANLANYPNAPLLTSQAYSALYAQYNWPGKYKVADTLFIYLAQTQNAYNDVAPNLGYHLWIVSNDGNGNKDLDYQLTLNFGASSTSAVRIDVVGTATPGSGTAGSDQQVGYPNFDRKLTASTVTLNMKSSKAQMAGAVVRNLPVPSNLVNAASSGFGLSISLSGSSLPTQVLFGGSSGSAKAVMDVSRIPLSQLTSGGVSLKGGNCQNAPSACPSLGCSACAADPRCGWCVETSQCQPGNAVGPAFGECANWRFIFDTATNRRVTQIPSYPVNPGLTEVYVASATDLPVQLGVVPAAWDKSQWDIVVFADLGNKDIKAQLSGQVQSFLSSASGFPNAAVYIASLLDDSYALIQAKVNPRATQSIPGVLNTQTVGSASTFNVAAALARFATADDIGVRPGARKVALFLVGRDHTANAISAATRDALLALNVVPVFAVPSGLTASYATFPASLGFGSVITLNNNYDAVLGNALRAAGSTVTVAVTSAQQTNTHLDYSAMSTDLSRFTIINLPDNFRAMFALPVRKLNNAVLTTDLYVPGYGSAHIENIPNKAPGMPESPWATNSNKYSIKDTGSQLIDLTGMSFRGLLSVTPQLTSVPSTGALFRAVRTQGADGSISYVEGDLIAAASVATPYTVADGKVLYKPVSGQSTTVSFSYQVFDKCLTSSGVTITIDVTPSNTAPLADMPNLITAQYTPIEFALDFGDDQKKTGGTYDLVITSTVASTDGALYQWYSGFNPASPNVNQLVTDGTVVSSNNNRFIYMPPQFKYSTAAAGSSLLILPCFDYKVVETGATTLESNTKQVLITVTHVNVPPFHWEQQNPAWPTALLGNWPSVADGLCYETGAACVFEEDLGAQFWWDAGLAQIYLGGNDVEGSLLNVTISTVDCFPGTTLLPPLDDETSVTAGYQIFNIDPAMVKPLLRFRPVAETYNELWATIDPAHPTDYYCAIGYTVTDDEGATSPEKIVKLSVTRVNKPPRLEEAETRKVAVEQTELPFFLDVVDPDGDAVTTEFLGCAKNQGSFSLCATIECTDRVTVDCSHIYDETNPTAVTLDVQAGVSTANGIAPLQGYFTSGPVATYSEGKDYNTYYFRFSDGVSPFGASNFAVYIDVVIINNPPHVLVQDEDRDVLDITKSAADNYNPGLSIIDVDFAAQDFYYMTVTATLDNTNHPTARFDIDALNAAVSGCQDNFVVTETSLTFTCQLPVVNYVLGALNVVGPITINPATAKGPAVLKVTASDNGFAGQCSASSATNDLCILTDTMTINIDYANFGGNNVVTVASSAAAAGVAGAAAIAAVALFRKFNKKAEESYAPWDANEDQDLTTNNPLYEASGSQGVSAIYDSNGAL